MKLFAKKTPQTPQGDFPLLAAQDIAYLDNGATTQKPEVVLRAIDAYYRTANANVHRGVYKLADASTQAYEDARHTVAQFLHVNDEEIVFTSGATHALNLAANILAAYIQPGDEILTTIAEHHATFVPFQQLALRTGATFVVVPLTQDQSITTEQINSHITPRTKIIAVSALSNVLGYALDVQAIRKQNAYLVIDAAQSIRHTQAYANADFVAFSAHKLYGPQGVGVLSGKQNLLEQGAPLITGGAMIQKVTVEASSWGQAPARFEAGTPNVAGAVGLAAAISFYQPRKAEAERREQELTEAIIAVVQRYGTILGPKHKGGPIVSFTLPYAHAHDIAQALDAAGVCVRAGHHCCQPLHDALGVDASVRVSPALYNTIADVERLENGLRQVEQLFK